MTELETSQGVSEERVDRVLRDAAELEDSDWGAAVDLLVSANRASRADAIEMALAAMRNRAFDRLEARLDAGVAPDPVQPAPVGEHGLPEAALEGLTAGAVRSAIDAHGCLLVRGAIDPERARALAERIDHTFDARVAYGPLFRSPDLPRSAWWDPLPVDREAAESLGRAWVRDGGGALLADSPRMMFELLETYEDMGLREVVTDLLSERPVLSANKCTLRRVGLDTIGGWHQDGAFLGHSVRAVNLWLTLTPCGVDAPGLDLVPRRFEHIVESGTRGADLDWVVSDEVVEEVSAGVGVLRPQFEAGDLLVFDHLFLHRTAIDPAMTRERHAVETWCFTKGAYPAGHVPLVW